MATVIGLGNGRFVAGDPADTLPVGYAWCPWCGGYGLEYDINDDLSVCGGCSGTGIGARRHPLVPVSAAA